MALPLTPPIEPMLARSAAEIPVGMAYEPKWDGFRCLVFRDESSVQLLSRNGRDLTRYFPEVVAAVLAETPTRCVLDGELVVAVGDRLEFERLSERIHPAQSRIEVLSNTFPASLVCWDLLSLHDDVLMDLPFSQRRELLVDCVNARGNRVHLTPLTTNHAVASEWFGRFEGAGLDGIVAKPLDGPYLPGKRAMVKVKHAREADVVVAGYRLHQKSTPQRPLLGSLQLGLFDGSDLHFVGVASAFAEKTRSELANQFDQLRLADRAPHPWSDAVAGVRRPGSVTRWSTELKQILLISPLLVCTVGYEHMQGTRFRHSAQFRRWRPERDPQSCSFEQLEEVPRYDLGSVLGSGTAPGSA
jgi:ATP-dependent DNA ligase